MRISAAVAILMLSILPAGAVAGTSGVTAIELLDDGSIVVPVTIGGRGPYRFVLDTGSSRSVISIRLLAALRLQAESASLMVTPAGSAAALIVRLHGLAIDGRSPVDVSAAVVAANRYAAGQHVDGLIGQDVLARSVYTIDYKQRAVLWHESGDVIAGTRLPLSVRDNRVLVSLHQSPADPRPLTFIPDSGSDGLVVFAHAQDRLRLTPIDVGVISSVTGARLARRFSLERLMVGSMRLENAVAVVVESSAPPTTMGDGLLPLHVFSRVTFNVGEGYLIVDGT